MFHLEILIVYVKLCAIKKNIHFGASVQHIAESVIKLLILFVRNTLIAVIHPCTGIQTISCQANVCLNLGLNGVTVQQPVVKEPAIGLGNVLLHMSVSAV